MYLENWFVDADGAPVDASIEYAMNLHLLMRCGRSGGAIDEIPIFIDPDTGNMGGGEP